MESRDHPLNVDKLPVFNYADHAREDRIPVFEIALVTIERPRSIEEGNTHTFPISVVGRSEDCSKIYTAFQPRIYEDPDKLAIKTGQMSTIPTEDIRTYLTLIGPEIIAGGINAMNNAVLSRVIK
ncbi:MAG: hypothetical protein WC796_03005 [Candidatus Pacearchaeota archaeon]|jgi:hypothetical protein